MDFANNLGGWVAMAVISCARIGLRLPGLQGTPRTHVSTMFGTIAALVPVNQAILLPLYPVIIKSG